MKRYRWKWLLAVLILLLLNSQATAAESLNRLSWSQAAAQLELKNATLKKLKNSAHMAYRAYSNQAESSKGINTEGMKLNIMGVETFISFDNYTKMLLTQQKELLPAQMKLSWEMTRDSSDVTKNSMLQALRGMYLGLYSADFQYKTGMKQWSVAQSLYKQAQVNHKNGRLTDTDLELAQYERDKAQADYDAAKRTRENTARSFHAFLGSDAQTVYDEIVYSEYYVKDQLDSLQTCIDRALTHRLEIIGPQRQMELYKLKKEILERNQVHQIYTAAAEDYGSLLIDMENTGLKLEKARLDVEKDIKGAYADVTAAAKKVKNTYDSYLLQKRNFEKMQKSYKLGLISKAVLDRSEIGYLQTEFLYRTTLFDYNSKRMKFQHACDLGPAYGEEE